MLNEAELDPHYLGVTEGLGQAWAMVRDHSHTVAVGAVNHLLRWAALAETTGQDGDCTAVKFLRLVAGAVTLAAVAAAAFVVAWDRYGTASGVARRHAAADLVAACDAAAAVVADDEKGPVHQ